MEKLFSDIINKLIEFRGNKGWSREELAERLGVSVKDIEEFEQGKSLEVLDKIVDFFIRTHTKDNYFNEWYTIDDLPFTEEQKAIVLEWFAMKIKEILQIFDPYWGDHHKSYDPLVITETVAHSYLFDFKDGGRHHSFKSLTQLERWLVEEAAKELLPCLLDEEWWNDEIKPRLLEWVKENFPHDTVEWILSYDE